MILQTQLVVAVRCHECGEVLTAPISLFDLGSGVTETLSCSCGSEDIEIGGRRFGELWLRIPCAVCSRTHFLTIPTSPLIKGELHPILCPASSLEMGFVGEAADVVELVELWEGELEQEVLEDWSGYFDHPEVMYELLERLHTLAEADELMCVCGSSRIEMEIFPDRLELSCTECGREDTLLAIDEHDLLKIQTLQVLRDDKDPDERPDERHTGFSFKNGK